MDFAAVAVSVPNVRECGNTLYPPHGQNQNHGFSFWFQFPRFLPVSKEKVVLVSGKSGFSFWFQFCLREGVGVFLPPLKTHCWVHPPVFFVILGVALHFFGAPSFSPIHSPTTPHCSNPKTSWIVVMHCISCSHYTHSRLCRCGMTPLACDHDHDRGFDPAIRCTKVLRGNRFSMCLSTPQKRRRRGFHSSTGIVQKVLSQRCSAHFCRILDTFFDSLLTRFWNVPLFPIKQDPFWRIFDACLTHFWRISAAFLLWPTPFPRTPLGRYRL